MAETTRDLGPAMTAGKPALKPLSEQVVVIMGASSGIGRETALQMARRGARLVVAARDGEALASLAAVVTGEGGEVLPVPARQQRSSAGSSR